MKWCRFEIGGNQHFGMVEDDSVVKIEGSPFGKHHITTQKFRIDQIRWLPPTIPLTFFCCGLNYHNHIMLVQKARGPIKGKFPDRPEIGYRANSALIGHEEPIVKPREYVGRLETEGELVAVIGRKIKKCSRDEARESILGWTMGNDVSAREWQYADRTSWRAKNSDTFLPMGPWIATDVDPMQSSTRISRNGILSAEFATGAMVFDVLDYIVEITKYITMHPGDVLWMGSDGSVGMAPGDTIEIEITGIGTLRNRVIEGD